MATLMGKYKTQEWKELDHTEPTSDYPEQEQMDYLLGEYKLACGQGWMFKWVDVEVKDKKELIPA